MNPIPFDMGYHFDTRLRDCPNDATQMAQGVACLVNQFHTKDLTNIERARLAGQIGGYCRLLKRLDEAETWLKTAVSLAQASNQIRLQTSNQIRLAHVYHWQQNFPQAEALFQKLIQTCLQTAAVTDYLDFVHQHFGKCKLDQQQYHAALHHLQTALTLRRQKGDSALIHSTETAVLFTQQRLKNHN